MAYANKNKSGAQHKNRMCVKTLYDVVGKILVIILLLFLEDINLIFLFVNVDGNRHDISLFSIYFPHLLIFSHPPVGCYFRKVLEPKAKIKKCRQALKLTVLNCISPKTN